MEVSFYKLYFNHTAQCLSGQSFDQNMQTTLSVKRILSLLQIDTH